jgi:spermidine synthase
LNPGGAFVQWLPLYQLTEYEFGVITRTMLEAFGQVTLWRNNFVPGGEKVALIGQKDPAPLPIPPDAHRKEMRDAVEGLGWNEASPDMVRPEPEAITFFYAGNLTAAREKFDSYPINTDDKPVIEYETPRTFRQIAKEQKVAWFVGPKLTGLVQQLLSACPVTEDPVLAGHPPSSQRLVIAGAAFHQAMIWKVSGKPESAQKEWEVFQRQWRRSAE